MFIKKITIENYRGVKNRQEIPLSNFSSIVGKNDSGKSIILNAIASYLDSKSYPITESDFNDLHSEIVISCSFFSKSLRELLETKLKSKIKKSDGLDEFLNDILFDGSITLRKRVKTPKKTFDFEEIFIRDFEDEEFSSLYLKTDEQLSALITKYSINIPIDGTGRNSKLEKIKHIKRFCLDSSKVVIEKFIQDDFNLSTTLPAVELFVSDYGLKADTSFKTNSVSELQTYFEDETSNENSKLNIIQKEIEGQMQIEAQIIKKYMCDYTSSLNIVEIKPSIFWKDAIKSVDVNFQFEGDEKPIPMSHKGTGYRRLFMVARFRYLAEKTKGSNIIYLVEEPETFLHPSAQEDLLSAFRELSEDNQIIVTTHSPIFAGATHFESIILCKKETQSVYEYADQNNKNKFILNIVEELGIRPSYNLRDTHEKIIFVESKNDAQFYNIITKLFFNFNLTNNPKILVLPFGGGTDIESFINIDYFDTSGRDLYLLIDSDKHRGGYEKQKKRVEEFNKKTKGQGYLLKKSCIENYYHPRALERIYSLQDEVFSFFTDESDVKKEIKQKIIDNSLQTQQIKEKNNIKIFEDMTKDEWDEILEVELKNFLKNIVVT